MDMALLRRYIRQHRELAGMTQAQMADRCSTSLRNYKRIETSGLKNFPLELLAIIAAALHIRVCDLLCHCELETGGDAGYPVVSVPSVEAQYEALVQHMDHALTAFQELANDFRGRAGV